MRSPTSYPIIIISLCLNSLFNTIGISAVGDSLNLRTETLIASVQMAEEGELSSPDELETSKSYILMRLW